MRKIKVKFVGVWREFEVRKNFIHDILEKRYEVEISEEPEYIFYSVFSDDYLKYDGIRIFFTGENYCPDFNVCDYALGFDHLEFEDRYLRFPLFYLYEEDLKLALKKHRAEKDILAQKTGFCSFVYSNQNADPFRTEFFERLCEYKKVDSGGRFLNNIGETVENKLSFEKQHKFSIAFENSSHNGYGTEKLLQSFAAETVPIYWGNPFIEKDFNKNAFLNCHNFHSVEDIIEAVKKIDQDDELYYTMLREPVFGEEKPQEMFKKLEGFFYHIIEQPYEQAFRRNRSQWGLEHEKRLSGYQKNEQLKKKIGNAAAVGLLKKWMGIRG